MSRIDLDQLKKEIQKMTRHNILYRLLRDELSKRGYWKARARGDPKKAYRISIGDRR